VSVNKHLPHVYVIPEDDANRQLAIGFYLEINQTRQMQVLPVAHGWNEVLRCFQTDHARGMDIFPNRYMVLLIDFDRSEARLEYARRSIPEHLVDRVFVLGIWSEPEDLGGLGSLETIGKGMARDCRDQTDNVWRHQLLRHNAAEIARLREHVRPILFPDVN
jgi:hypothetical protein